MRPDSLYSRKQRFTQEDLSDEDLSDEDLSDDDSKLLLLSRIVSKSLA